MKTPRRTKKAETKNKEIKNNFLAFSYRLENPEIPYSQVSAAVFKILKDDKS